MTLRSCFLAEAAAGATTSVLSATMSAATVRRGQVDGMRASVAEAVLRRDWLERLGAVGGADRLLEQCVLGRAQLGIGVEQRGRAHAGALEQLGVLREPRDPELGEPGLARAEHLALPPQREVDLGELVAVAVVGGRAQARRLLG